MHMQQVMYTYIIKLDMVMIHETYSTNMWHIYMSKGERLASSNLYIFEDLSAWVGLCA